MTNRKISDMVYDYIVENIHNENWKPGDRIPTEYEICKTLNCSRTSVRSAISKLTSLGILKSTQGLGTFVCKDFSGSVLNSIEPILALQSFDRISVFEFRKIIEVETAALAALRATNDTVDKLKSLTSQMESSFNPEDIVFADMQFHYQLAKASNNLLIVKTFNSLKPIFIKMFEENISVDGGNGACFHRKIISAIEIRNPVKAKEYMQEHLEAIFQKMQSKK